MNFSTILLNWYDANKRDFPWRNTGNPYVIWVTEVVFQQTRIEQGLPFFVRFIEAFPTVNDLAMAKEEQVLKLWQGLGYYSRARNLHFSAKHIVDNLDGNFPKTYKDLLTLKGVGPYIAAEVASVCFGEVIAAVDGNVQRVISRYFGVKEAVNQPKGEKQIKAFANEYIPHNRPGDYNQALMDFGSTMCTPRNPNCTECIFSEDCLANRKGIQTTLPVKVKKVKVRKRYFDFLLLFKNGKLAMQKRKAGDVWQGLYQPLMTESSTKTENIENIYGTGYLLSKSIRVLSHQKLFLNFWVLDELTMNEFSNVEWIKTTELNELPVPKSIEQLFSSNEFMNLY